MKNSNPAHENFELFSFELQNSSCEIIKTIQESFFI